MRFGNEIRRQCGCVGAGGSEGPKKVAERCQPRGGEGTAIGAKYQALGYRLQVPQGGSHLSNGRDIFLYALHLSLHRRVQS
jgi:hypothetical protein